MAHGVLQADSSRSLAKAITQLFGSQADVQEGPCTPRAHMQQPTQLSMWESGSARRSFEKGQSREPPQEGVLVELGSSGDVQGAGPGWRRCLAKGFAQWSWVRHGSRAGTWLATL